jgi:putative aldouronate transport system permease protein
MKKGNLLFEFINSMGLIFFALLCVYPFIYIFFIATSNGDYLVRGEVNFLPRGFNFAAFQYILSNPKFNVALGLRNSFMYTLWGTIFAVVTTYITAFVLSRQRFVHRHWIMGLFVITWVFDAGIIPQYIIYNAFGYVDNPLVMIIPGAISTQFLIITKNYLDGIPRELEEAAFADGANDLVILGRIYVPLSSTIIATIATFNAVLIWNQYLIPQIYLKTQKYHTIQQLLKSVALTGKSAGTVFSNIIVNGFTLNQQNLQPAAIFVTMLPIVLVYPFVQKYFKKGILIGSIKG